MKKIFTTLSLLVLMTSCTMPWKKEDVSMTISAELPSQAKSIDGYDYPAIPLDEFNKLNTGTNN